MTLVPEGKYLAKGTVWDLGMSDNHNDFIQIMFKLLEGEYAGQLISWQGYFTEKTEKSTIESLRYCGWKGDNFLDLEGLDRNIVQVTVEHQESQNGNKYARIAWVNKPGNLAIKNPMDDKKRAAFAKRMKGICASIPKSLAESTPNNKDLPFPDEPVDDLPF